jgi:hypothetical protein
MGVSTLTADAGAFVPLEIFLRASPFNQFHQPSSMKSNIGIFLGASAFNQFHQTSSTKLEFEIFLIASAFHQFHQPLIRFASMVLDKYFKKALVLDLWKT